MIIEKLLYSNNHRCRWRFTNETQTVEWVEYWISRRRRWKNEDSCIQNFGWLCSRTNHDLQHQGACQVFQFFSYSLLLFTTNEQLIIEKSALYIWITDPVIATQCASPTRQRRNKRTMPVPRKPRPFPPNYESSWGPLGSPYWLPS